MKRPEQLLKDNIELNDWNNLEEQLPDTLWTSNVIKYMNKYAMELKQELHKALEDTVSFDNESEKSNFIIEIMEKVNSL